MSLWDTCWFSISSSNYTRMPPRHARLAFTGATGAPAVRRQGVFAAALLCDRPDPQNRGCGQCKEAA